MCDEPGAAARWVAGAVEARLAAARHGEPSLLRVPCDAATRGVVPAVCRAARRAGCMPVRADRLAGTRAAPMAAMRDRTLVVMVGRVNRRVLGALGALGARDPRPHVVVWFGGRDRRWRPAPEAGPVDGSDAPAEARRRWAAILAALAGGPGSAADRSPRLRVSETRKAEDMSDELLSVLRICQDIEDEQTALARVGAYVRERLRASTVAFVLRDGGRPVVVAHAGPETVGLDAAMRAMDTGVEIAAAAHGSAEHALPVRHAAEVVGAVWCRWADEAGRDMARAVPLLGVAAAAVGPSLRLAGERLRAVPAASAVPGLVGESAGMQAVREAVTRAARSPFPVLIEGESGSGKELVAGAVHALSARRTRRMAAINCAALVDDLVEAELFGHARGAFTGAALDRAGLFEEADGSSLFLDEVAELGARVQAKLLRTIQEGEVRRLGENQLRRVDVRLIAATNRPLAEEVACGRFRRDLWYRLDVVRIQVPPLRARLEDLPSLARHFWRALADRTGSRAVLSAAAIAALGAYDWPGNVRELQNVLASMMVSAPPRGVVGVAALPAHVTRVAAMTRTPTPTLVAARRQFEARYV
ncbi:MAG: sigma 54-interacting transcriptional regulator, partial [Acidobacteriota bacterium]